MRYLSLFLAVFCISSTLMGQVPSTINFQGNLNDLSGNTVGDGDYTMEFSIYDAAVAGTTGWLETQSVMVMNGIFNVKLGAATPLDPYLFDRQVWLQITVDGEPLSPRIALSSTPYSQNTATYSTPYTKVPDVGFTYIAGDTSTQNYPFSPTIDMAIDDNDTGFDVPTDGNLSFYTNGQERMSLNLVGRLNLGGAPISAGTGTLFEINTDPQGTSWGGMWMTNSAETGRPYYGYQNGLGSAFTYMDGNDWKLSVVSDRLIVTAEGNVGIGNNNPTERLSVFGDIAASDTIKADVFAYNNPEVKYYSIPPNDYEIAGNNASLYKFIPSNGIYNAVAGGSGLASSMIAPINLPDGAIITGFKAGIFDGDVTNDVSMEIRRQSMGSVSSPSSIPGTFVSSSGNPSFDELEVTNLSIPINNELFAYTMRFNTRDNNPSNLVIYVTRITYIVPGP